MTVEQHAGRPTMFAMDQKACTKCDVRKPLTEFYKRKDSSDGYFAYCKACKAIAAAARYEANPERVRAYSRAWRKANTQRKRANSRAWREANRERERANKRARYAANPERARATQHRRRAYKAATVVQRWQVHDILPFCCYWCGANLRAYGATTHIDHVMPISLGGPDTPDNRVNSCATCNLTKQATHPLVWIAQLVTA